MEYPAIIKYGLCKILQSYYRIYYLLFITQGVIK